MKHKLIYFILVMAFFSYAALSATVTVCPGSTGQQVPPISVSNYSSETFSNSANIYYPSEFGSVSFPLTLTDISWRILSGSGLTTNNSTLNIYVKETTVTNFSSNPNWSTLLSGATLVYRSTTQNINNTTGYQTFTFNQNGGSFVYNGGSSNLMVICIWEGARAAGRTMWATTVNSGPWRCAINIAGSTIPLSNTVWVYQTITEAKFSYSTAGVSMAPITANSSGYGGTIVNYQFNGSNSGGSSDSYNLTLSGNSWNSRIMDGVGGNLISTVGPISASGNFSIWVEVSIPHGATSATDGFTLQAASQSNPLVTASCTRTTTRIVADYSMNQTETGSGDSSPWSPSFPPDPQTGNLPPVVIDFPLNASGNPTQVSLSYTSTVPPIITQPIPANLTIGRFWNIELTGGANYSATLDLYFTDDQIPAGLLPLVVPSNLPSTSFNSTTGMLEHSYVAAVTLFQAGTPNVYRAQILNVTNFSTWVLGGGGTLPVEMTSFIAVGGDSRVNLRWRTESEYNNHHFNLYRSHERNIQGELIVQIPGNGTCANSHDYTYSDRRVQNEITYYYHIVDIAFDGSESIHSLVASATPSAAALGILPLKYSLAQNYPNPFNPSTRITYGIKNAEMVHLTIHDVLGREVATLVNQFQKPNTYRVVFDASSLPPGMYFYQLETGSFKSAKKMTLSK